MPLESVPWRARAAPSRRTPPVGTPTRGEEFAQQQHKAINGLLNLLVPSPEVRKPAYSVTSVVDYDGTSRYQPVDSHLALSD